jgi:type I restriction enzyme, S subunit
METAEKLITENLDIWTSAVKAKSSAGRGSGSKRELYGIQKLRELILELAVMGKLVPQDSNDEPASELLKKIAAERSKLIKQGKLKKQKKLTDIAESDQPYSIPPSWEWIRLGNATNYGVSDKAEANDVDEDTWVLELEDVEKSTSRLLKKVRVSERNFKSSKNRFDKSDVIYGKLRPYLDKVLVVDEPGVCTTEMIPIRAYTSIEPTFLRWAMKSPYFIQYANKSTHGMNLPRMGTDKAREALIPLAPEKEQHRIVAKVDELMALCDQLEQEQESSLDTHDTLIATLLGALTTATADAGQFAEAWQRIQANFDTLFTTESSIDQLKQTILQLAVMGKLVPQDPEDEPAAELLDRIAVEKAMLIKEEKLKKQKTLPPIDHDEKPFVIPKNWEWVRLQEITKKITDGDHKTPPRNQSGKRLFSAKNVRDGFLDYENCDFISVGDFNKSRERCLPEEGDLLMVSVGGTIGRSSLVPKDSNFALVRSVALIKPLGFASKYLKYTADAPILQDSIHSNKRGGAQPCLYLSEISKFPFPLPPLAEQHRIVAKVDELMALCDQLKASLATAQTTQLNLADSLVEQAIG